MRLYRFFDHKSARVLYGLESGDRNIQEIEDPFARPLQQTGRIFLIEDIHVLAPVIPSKIIAVGLNYQDHIREMGHGMPTHPVLFMKPSTAVLDPLDWIRLPVISKQVDFEAELAVVIGKTGKNILAQDAYEYILGFTCFNDVTARDLQRNDGQWTRAKSFDSFAPLGPHIETALDPHDLTVTCLVNGAIRQQSSTSQLLFPVEQLVEFISGVMTLLPGDVIATGTPAGVGPLQDGDRVEILIDGIGSLINPVKAE